MGITKASYEALNIPYKVRRDVRYNKTLDESPKLNALIESYKKPREACTSTKLKVEVEGGGTHESI